MCTSITSPCGTNLAEASESVKTLYSKHMFLVFGVTNYSFFLHTVTYRALQVFNEDWCLYLKIPIDTPHSPLYYLTVRYTRTSIANFGT